MMNSEQHILIVDDDPTLLETICEGLLIHGFNVIPAKTPQEALTKIEDKKVDFALIDLDLGSPEMNGIELGHELTKQIPAITVLIMTGYHNVKMAIEATREYSFHHLIKPFQVDQLLTMMERIEMENKLKNENKELRAKILILEKEIEKLNKKNTNDVDDSKYQSQVPDPNRLHTIAVKSYEQQKKQKSVNAKKK
ncbi:response regulator [Calditrichota bacterium]